MNNLANSTQDTTDLTLIDTSRFNCANFFSMHRTPFTLTPKKENIYAHDNFIHVKNTILFGISAGERLLQITGDIGSGKTLLINDVLSSVDHQHYPIRILNPRISPVDLLCQIIDEFGRPYPIDATIEQLLRLLRFTLHEHYTQTDANILVWIDDAHFLSRNTLIIIDKISSWSTPNRALLQFIISGSNELNNKLSHSTLSSLRNNIRFTDKIENMRKDEIAKYVKSCIQSAERHDEPQFTPQAFSALFKYSKGNPSAVNTLAYKALLLAYGKGRRTISHQYVNAAFKERYNKKKQKTNKWLVAAVTWIGINLALGGAFMGGYL